MPAYIGALQFINDDAESEENSGSQLENDDPDGPGSNISYITPSRLHLKNLAEVSRILKRYKIINFDRIFGVTDETRTALKNLGNFNITPANNNYLENEEAFPPLQEPDISMYDFVDLLLTLREDEISPANIRSFLAQMWNPWHHGRLFSDSVIHSIIELLRKGQTPYFILAEFNPYPRA